MDAYLRSLRSRNTEWKSNFQQGETMHTKEAIKFALTVSNGAVLSVINKMSDAATTFPTPNGGGHPLRGFGDLQKIEGRIPGGLLRANNTLAEWQKPFMAGS